jgi:hypothetical protein
LQAKSRHQHLAGLGRHVRLGEQTSARITAEAAIVIFGLASFRRSKQDDVVRYVRNVERPP